MRVPHTDEKAAYERLRVAHVNAVRASLEDHVARLEWPRERIEHYRTERLRSLLAFVRERSPFHAARMADIDPTTATVDDLERLPPMVKQDAQDQWDAIVTSPDINRARSRAGAGPAALVLLHARWTPGVQLGRIKRRTRGLRLGLGGVRHARLSRLAVAAA